LSVSAPFAPSDSAVQKPAKRDFTIYEANLSAVARAL
jgi:hypothetical protein